MKATLVRQGPAEITLADGWTLEASRAKTLPRKRIGDHPDASAEERGKGGEVTRPALKMTAGWLCCQVRAADVAEF